MTRRTQLLLDEERYRRLERQAQATNSSIAAVVRDAIDVAYPTRSMSPGDALQLLRDAPPGDHGDPRQVKQDLIDRHEPQ